VWRRGGVNAEAIDACDFCATPARQRACAMVAQGY